MIKKTLLLAVLLSAIALPAYTQPKGNTGPTAVIITTAAKREVSDRVEALGTLRANETVTLNSNVTDMVTALRFDDGQRVKQGDVLVEMSNAEESAELKEMQANVSEAGRQVQRLKPLVAQGAASKSALDTQNRNYQTAKAQLEATKSRLKDRIITAPFDGIVGLRNISIGALLQPGMMITTLDDDSVMKLDFSVPSLFLSTLKEGTPIEARTKAYPEIVFKGNVKSIASQVDPITRSIVVRAIIPNDEKILRPGLLMTVTLKKNIRTAIAVPELALITEGANQYVYVVDGDKARKQKISIGAREPGFVEVTQGLKEGDKIVTDGVMKISDGAPITIRAEKTGDETLDELLKQNQAPAPESKKPE